MKFTAFIYILFIFVSCANKTPKTAQETPSRKTTEESNIAIIKETETLEENQSVDTEQEKEAVMSKTPEMVIEKDMEQKKEVSPMQKTKDEMVKTEMEEETNAENHTPAAEVEVKGDEPEVKEDTPVEASNPVSKEEETKTETTEEIVLAKVPSHANWDKLLRKYVDNTGNVDYKSFKNSSSELSAYLEMLAKNSPKTDWSKNERLAYYINLYNAATVKLILDNYPTKSIKDISRPWGKDIVKIGNDVVSLGHIEHKILRKMNEPRIHFAINCASYSCPKLVNKAFTASGMSAQLEAATKDFVNDTTRNQFTASEAKLSEIFKWYKGDFTDKGSLKDYINNYLSTPMTASTKIKYLKYDWNLNEKR